MEEESPISAGRALGPLTGAAGRGGQHACMRGLVLFGYTLEVRESEWCSSSSLSWPSVLSVCVCAYKSVLCDSYWPGGRHCSRSGVAQSIKLIAPNQAHTRRNGAPIGVSSMTNSRIAPCVCVCVRDAAGSAAVGLLNGVAQGHT